MLPGDQITRIKSQSSLKVLNTPTEKFSGKMRKIKEGKIPEASQKILFWEHEA